MPPIFKLFARICVLHIIWINALTEATPLSKKIVKGKLHRFKRDLDILAECDLQCLQEDEIKDYELIIEYEDGPDNEDPNTFFSDDDSKKCAYACKILDIEKVEDTDPGIPGEIRISFEDELLGGFRTNLEGSSLSAMASTSTTTTSPTTPSNTSLSAIKSPDELLKECLSLFAAFDTETPKNSSEHPCSYFQKKVATSVAPVSNKPSSLSASEHTTKSENSSSTSTSPTVSYTVEPVVSTVSSLTLPPMTEADSSRTLEENSEPMQDTSPDVALRVLPVDRRLGSYRTPSTLPPRRVIPKKIRYTVVEAEMGDEESDGNLDPPEVVGIHEIDPEVIRLVHSSISHVSSGLSSIKNMSKDIPLKNHLEFRKSKPEVDSNYNLSVPSSFKAEENIPQETEYELENTNKPVTLHDLNSTQSSTTAASTTARTENTLMSSNISVSVTTERTSTIKSASYPLSSSAYLTGYTNVSTSIPLATERASESPAPTYLAADIAITPGLSSDLSPYFSFAPFKPDIPRGHFTRNKTRTVITSQNITSVQTNHTFEFYAYAIVNDGNSTTSKSKPSEEVNFNFEDFNKSSSPLSEASAQYMPVENVAPRKSNEPEANKSSLINDSSTTTTTSKALVGINLGKSSTVAPEPSNQIFPGENVSEKALSAQVLTLRSIEGSAKTNGDKITSGLSGELGISKSSNTDPIFITQPVILSNSNATTEIPLVGWRNVTDDVDIQLTTEKTEMTEDMSMIEMTTDSEQSTYENLISSFSSTEHFKERGFNENATNVF